MPITVRGAIDCDVHPGVPPIGALLPYMDEYWQENFVSRGLDGFTMGSYPPNAPISCRPDWAAKNGSPAADLGTLQADALNPFQARFAICNTLSGGMVAVSERMGAALCGAVNDWIADKFLSRDPRLRASIVVTAQSPELAVAEIERLADDHRFVQVLIPVAVDMPLGKSFYWPIFEACQRHGLPLGLHAGTMYRHAPTSTGWPTHFLQDYVSNTQAFEAQLLSLVTEGVFGKFPDLKIVLIESGVTWLPGLLWRAVKTWRGVRGEIPWVKQSPAELIREHVRLTVQPIDAPSDPKLLERIIDQIGSDDMLLFSTDYPHWQFEGEAALPEGIPHRLLEKIMVDNPLATYSRLKETVQ